MRFLQTNHPAIWCVSMFWGCHTYIVELHDQTARDNQIVRSVLLLWGGPGFHLTLETPNCGHHNGYDVMFI